MDGDKFVGFQGSRVEVDQGKPFFIFYEGVQALFNGQPLDLSQGVTVSKERKQVGDDLFLEIKTRHKMVFITFLHSIEIKRISPRSVVVTKDDDPPFALGVKVNKIACGGEVTDFMSTDVFTYHAVEKGKQMLKFEMKKNRIRFWFVKTMTMAYVPMFSDMEDQAD